MGQLRDLKPPRRHPHLRTLTDIHAPRVEEEVVNGKVKCSLTPAKPGVITIISDDENEEDPTYKSRGIKRERSQIPSRVVGHSQRSNQPAIKQEPPLDRQGRQSHGQTSPVAGASGTRQPQVHEPLCRHGAHGTLNASSDSSSASDSSEPDSSDSPESEYDSDSSSDSSSSNGGSSEDETSISTYRPSTPLSNFGSSPPRTRQVREPSGQAVSTDPAIDSPAQRPLQNAISIGFKRAPLDFFIEIPTHPLPSRQEQAVQSRSHTSSAVASAPAYVQADRTAPSDQHRYVNSSFAVLGVTAINRRSPPPPNAPTEPRAMRTVDARPAGTPVDASPRSNESNSEPASESSSPIFRGLRLVKDNSQQKDKQRRGPARPGRVMQTIEQPPVERPSARIAPSNGSSSRHLRPATPGPSYRRPATPQPSPPTFVTPRAEFARSFSVSSTQETPQSMSRSQGKRPMDETGRADSTSKTAELKRMLEKFKSHEKEMEQQRAKLAQLEDTKRMVAELKTRVDNLEQRERQRAEERHVASRRGRPRRQPERRERRGRCNASRVAGAPLCEQERQLIEQARQDRQERQEDLELEQQLEQDQRREVERLQRASHEDSQRGSVQIHFETEDEAQLRIQHEIFTRPLSGHNPDITFDDADRPNVSKATAFLIRLSQEFVLSKLRQLIRGRAFFDLAHPGSVYMGCWVVSKRASCDSRMKLTESSETHGFSFEKLAVRLWHDEQSIYSLLEHGKRGRLAVHICHTETCMRPDHIAVEPTSAMAERRSCKREGRCPGHRTVHKDGTVQVRKACIFPPRGVFVRQ